VPQTDALYSFPLVLNMPKLKETSSLAERIRKVEDLCRELGLTIDASRYDHNVCIDDEHTGLRVEYRDIEQRVSSGSSTTHFPWDTETHLLVSDERWERYQVEKGHSAIKEPA